MNIPIISKRLEAAASFVRRGARIADIGTDHAYLPIYLYLSGKTSGGVVSDINAGPVARAKENLAEYGCTFAFVAQRADGLEGVLGHEVDDIFILGMGGELIASILDAEPNIRDGRYRLILQPMTHPEILRSYLASNGFETVAERVIIEEKFYQIICAEYTGRVSEPDDFELCFGALNLAERSPELCGLMRYLKKVYGERIKGKSIAGADDRYERYMTEKINEFLKSEPNEAQDKEN